MIIEFPVKCHNNHEAKAYFQFHPGRMEFVYMGVPESQNCAARSSPWMKVGGQQENRKS